MLQVLVGLDAAVLGPLVVDGARGVEEGHVASPACAQVDLLQLQLVSGVEVLFGGPEHAPVQDLPGGRSGQRGAGEISQAGKRCQSQVSVFRRVGVVWEGLGVWE